MSLWNYIRGNMMHHLYQTVGEQNAKMTYEELIVYSEKMAQKLTGEKICLIYCHWEMSAAIALLSCLAAGVTAVPVSVRYGEVHAQKILKMCSPSCVITDMYGKIEVYHISDTDSNLPKKKPALIMWTSGTTGIPKGIMLSERNITINIRDITSYFTIDSSDSILIARPLSHCAVLTGEFLTALIKGTRIVFCSESFNPALLISLIKQQKITVFCGTPTLLTLLSRFSRNSRAELKHIAVSGECMTEETGHQIRRAFPHANIYHVYGLTEASPRISCMPPEHFDEAPDCVGVPLASVKLEIRDEKGIRVPKGEKGILWVRGRNVMQGYYLAPDLTREVMKDKWLCTGDIAEITEKGWLKIHGRSDDLIIRAGVNIYPQEIEAELKKDSRTREVLVYGYKNSQHMTQIGLKISGDYLNESEVHTLCKQLLSPYQMPSKIELVDKILKNSAGKIMRHEESKV